MTFSNPRSKPLVVLAESVKIITVVESPIKLQSSIESLGVYLDSHMSLKEHVSEICKASYFHIRALRHIRSSLTTEAAKTIAVAIVGSRLDYCNSLLAGTSASNLAHLQVVQNILARVVAQKSWYCHITPVIIIIIIIINQTLFSATYTMTSGQLYIVYNCSNLNKISLSNAMICRIEQKSFQFLFEKHGVRDQSNVNGQAIPPSWCSDGERPL